MPQNIASQEYDNHAAEYDAMSREAAPWVFFDKPYLESKLVPQLHSKTKLLELGCGGGKVVEMLCKNNLKPDNVTGIDISKELIKIAKSRMPAARLIVGDMVKTQVKKNYFDVALSVRSLEYLDIKDLKKVFENVYTQLKALGKFYIIVGHPLRVNDGDISRYLDRGARYVSLPWGMKVSLFHKIISDYITAAISSGFTLNFIDEPKMPALLKKKNPKKYEKYMSYGGATNLHFIFSKK